MVEAAGIVGKTGAPGAGIPGTPGTDGTTPGCIGVVVGLTSGRTVVADGFVIAVGNLTGFADGCGNVVMLVVVLGKTGFGVIFVNGLGATFNGCCIGALVRGILVGIDGKEGKFVVCESTCQHPTASTT